MDFYGTLRVNKFTCFAFVLIFFLSVFWHYASAENSIDKNNSINIKSLLKAAINAAERGGKKLIESKSKNIPVTDADYTSYCAIFHGLKNIFQELTILSDKHDDDSNCNNEAPINIESTPIDHRIIEYMDDEYVVNKDIAVWIASLDGKREFTEGYYEHVTTMVCVAINGVPTVGVIHYPFPPRTYWGWYTKKTSTNIPNVDYKKDTKNHPRVVISHSNTGSMDQIAKEAFGDQIIVSKAGVGDVVLGVVNGTYDVYLDTTTAKKSDLCAGNAIIKTVEGKFTTIKGEEIDYSPNSGDRTDGILVTRYDHDYYLSKLPKT